MGDGKYSRIQKPRGLDGGIIARARPILQDAQYAQLLLHQGQGWVGGIVERSLGTKQSLCPRACDVDSP